MRRLQAVFESLSLGKSGEAMGSRNCFSVVPLRALGSFHAFRVFFVVGPSFGSSRLRHRYHAA